MEITINDKYNNIKVTVESDEETIDGIIDRLIVPALLGVGFNYELIRQYIPEIDE